MGFCEKIKSPDCPFFMKVSDNSSCKLNCYSICFPVCKEKEEEEIDMDEMMSFVNEQVFGVWFLIGAALVFWMQAGFAMVEAGFTRAKNSGNIIMKNLMDFCIGTVMWFLIGASLMLPSAGGDIMGVIGTPGFGVFTDYADFSYSGFVFNLVFCATTATIVSGSMAERTKFSTYCLYSAIISGIIYPIRAQIPPTIWIQLEPA